jgi:hypothetical protein
MVRYADRPLSEHGLRAARDADGLAAATLLLREAIDIQGARCYLARGKRRRCSHQEGRL